MTIPESDYLYGGTYSYSYDKPLSSEMKSLVEQMFAWKVAKQQLEPEDVINYLVEAGFVTEKQAKDHFVVSKEKIRLPNKTV